MRTRSIKKQFWLNEQENETLSLNSMKAGMTESDYLRYIILGYTIKEKPDDRFYEMMKQMRSVAHNLNQLTVKAHSLGFIDELSLNKQKELWIKFMDEIKEEFLINKKGE